jgi:hypothetical protein
MDGAFYHDTRAPHIIADIAAVTLATTYKAIVPASNYPNLGGQYMWAGKRLRLRAFGRITTALTPGNMQIGVLWGTGADNNGVNVCQSAAVALTASQTNLSWEAEFLLHCRSIGSAGTVFGTGRFLANNAVLATSLQPLMVPGSAPAVSSAIDLTAALIPSIQFLRSGSTVETIQAHDFQFDAFN